VPQKADDRPHAEARDGTTEIMVPRQTIAQTVRKGQDPLANGDRRKDVVHEVCGALRHPPSATTRTARAGFARERHQAVEATVPAPEASEAAGQTAAPQEFEKLPFDEPGQPFPIPQARGLRAEGLEVLANDLVQDGRRRRPWLVLPRS